MGTSSGHASSCRWSSSGPRAPRQQAGLHSLADHFCHKKKARAVPAFQDAAEEVQMHLGRLVRGLRDFVRPRGVQREPLGTLRRAVGFSRGAREGPRRARGGGARGEERQRRARRGARGRRPLPRRRGRRARGRDALRGRGRRAAAARARAPARALRARLRGQVGVRARRELPVVGGILLRRRRLVARVLRQPPRAQRQARPLLRREEFGRRLRQGRGRHDGDEARRKRALPRLRGRRARWDVRENGGLGRGRVHAARGPTPAGHGLRSGRRRRARRGGDDLFDGARRGRREHVPLGRGLFERVPRVPRPGLGPVRLGHRALRPHARLRVRVAHREDVQPPGPAEARRGLRGTRPLRDARLPPRVARGHRPASRGRDDFREMSEASRIR